MRTLAIQLTFRMLVLDPSDTPMSLAAAIAKDWHVSPARVVRTTPCINRLFAMPGDRVLDLAQCLYQWRTIVIGRVDNPHVRRDVVLHEIGHFISFEAFGNCSEEAAEAVASAIRLATGIKRTR